jgi:drug/metabolite transporter (DMT)-like permease
VLAATLLALGAAVLHSAWNFAVKQSGDRFASLWGQFVVAGLVSATLLLAFPSLREFTWGWALLSGALHVPYVLLLTRAYSRSDFSVAYPIARGGGALVAGIGGVALLHDHLRPIGWLGMAVVASGLIALGEPWRRDPAVVWALLLALDIGAYTVIDAKGSRASASAGYVLGGFLVGAVLISATGLSMRRTADLRVVMAANWRKVSAAGMASMVTYGMVLLAVRHASVGYVASIRECSVVLAALAGWRFLDEGRGRGAQRLGASAVVACGLIVLVVGR